MTEKKHKSDETTPALSGVEGPAQKGGGGESQSDPADGGAPLPDGQDRQDKALTESVSVEEVEMLTSHLAQSELRAAEYLEGWQRAQAEFANYKKRLERDNAAFREIARGDVIKRFLPVVDDLERALANRPSEEDAWVGGIELVYRKLLAILDSEGLKRIEAEGKTFDPNLHEAISHEHNEDFESGQVIAVVQQGYMLGDRVIRHAMVRVAA